MYDLTYSNKAYFYKSCGLLKRIIFQITSEKNQLGLIQIKLKVIFLLHKLTKLEIYRLKS